MREISHPRPQKQADSPSKGRFIPLFFRIDAGLKGRLEFMAREQDLALAALIRGLLEDCVTAWEASRLDGLWRGSEVVRALGGRVTGVCSSRNRDLVASLGADEVADYNATDLRSLRGPFDVVFDAFGNRTFDELRHLLTPRGAYVTTVPSLPSLGQHVLSFLRPGRKAWMMSVRSNAADLRTLAQMADEGLIRPVIDRRFPLAESAKRTATWRRAAREGKCSWCPRIAGGTRYSRMRSSS